LSEYRHGRLDVETRAIRAAIGQWLQEHRRRALSPADVEEGRALLGAFDRAWRAGLANRKAFGADLRLARSKARLTQAEVGSLVGRHANTVAQWERGEQLPEPLVQEAVLARLSR